MNMRTAAAVTTHSAPPPRQPVATTALAADLRAFWEAECVDWDQLVTGAVAGVADEIDVWNDMPTVDSKAVARTSPIFQKHLGIPLDSSLIRPGGYKTLEEMIEHLVPLMMETAKKRQPAVAGQEAR